MPLQEQLKDPRHHRPSPPLPIELFASRDLEDLSTRTAENNNSNNEEDNNNNNEDDKEDYETNKDSDLPSYILRLVIRLENMDLDDVIEEAVEGGDGGDSDVETDDCLDHDEAMVTDQAERNEEDDLVVDENYCTSVVLSQGEMEAIHNAKIPGAPDDWIPLPAKTEKGEPQFERIDNPSGLVKFHVLARV